MCAIRWLSGGSPDKGYPQKRESGQNTGQEMEYWDTCPLPQTLKEMRGSQIPSLGPSFPLCKRSVLAWVSAFLRRTSGPGFWWWAGA